MNSFGILSHLPSSINRLFGFEHPSLVWQAVGSLCSYNSTFLPNVLKNCPEFSQLTDFLSSYLKQSYLEGFAGFFLLDFVAFLTQFYFTLSFWSTTPNALAPVREAEELSRWADLRGTTHKRCANPNFLPLEFIMAQGCFTSY